jgi:hypothetical protein
LEKSLKVYFSRKYLNSYIILEYWKKYFMGEEMKKIYPILVIGIFILGGFGASAESIFNIDEKIEWGYKETLVKPISDELDVNQSQMNFFAPVGPIFLAPHINYISAQSFIPTKSVLTRVEIMAGKNSTTTFDFTLAIRDDLLGPDLTSLSLSAAAFPTENFSWVEFDFTNIAVTPGTTYYIVCSTVNSSDNWYAVGAMLINVYPDGSVWWSVDDGSSFENDPDADLTFRTYGLDNSPPGETTITGPNSGKKGTTYNFIFNATDPDGDDVAYHINWGDNTTDTTESNPSGTDVTVSHDWAADGVYTIKAYATDKNGLMGPEATFEITIPRNKPDNNNFQFFYWLFQKFPNLFPILKYILDLF